MSASTAKLLRAAAEIVGGSDALAERLNIDARLLAKYMADLRELPDALLLCVVDIILADRKVPRPSGIDLAGLEGREAPSH